MLTLPSSPNRVRLKVDLDLGRQCPGEIGEEGNRALEDAEKDGTPPA